jgi:hypothetical protein
MAESSENFFEECTHLQRDVSIAETDQRNYTTVQNSDRHVADLSATRAEHAADANIPEAIVDGYGYLQLIDKCGDETVSTSTACTQPDKLDVVQRRPLADFEISLYAVSVVEQVGSKVSRFSFADNTFITSAT